VYFSTLVDILTPFLYDLSTMKPFEKSLTRWYRKNKRDLPWRHTQDPYPIWVSEIMLQQTQVQTVIPYYHRFLKAFPTLKHLAKAPEVKVLKLWEGLGYYARARNLRKACQEILKTHEGKIPQDPEALSNLPGIGPYTTGAILSIAFQKPMPVVDGNVSRVFCRVFGIRNEPTTPKVRKKLWQLATQLVPKKNPGDFNQALMELGATICTPYAPACDICPVQRRCTAYRLGLQEKIPMPSKRAAVKKAHAAVALVRIQNKILVRRRPSHGLLGGLWEFPQFVYANEKGHKKLKADILKELGIQVEVKKAAISLNHRFTHLDLTLTCYPCVPKNRGVPKKRAPNARWTRIRDLSKLPLPRAHQKIARHALLRTRRSRVKQSY
jgi:A/G-specific adenine glycosylase